jgi:hypothetical protein
MCAYFSERMSDPHARLRATKQDRKKKKMTKKVIDSITRDHGVGARATYVWVQAKSHGGGYWKKVSK